MTSTSAIGIRDQERWRLGLALCASVAAHAWLLAMVPGSERPHVGAVYSVNLRIEARMIAQEKRRNSNLGDHESGQVAEHAEAAEESSRTPERRPVKQARVSAESKPAPNSLARSPAAFPQPIDVTWYGAHELDSYPRALAPIELDRRFPTGSGRPAASVLLWLRIDEQGRLVEVAAGETGISTELLEAARASLADVKFTPGRKDERAVKSRLLLSVSFGPAVKSEQ